MRQNNPQVMPPIDYSSPPYNTRYPRPVGDSYVQYQRDRSAPRYHEYVEPSVLKQPGEERRPYVDVRDPVPAGYTDGYGATRAVSPRRPGPALGYDGYDTYSSYQENPVMSDWRWQRFRDFLMSRPRQGGATLQDYLFSWVNEMHERMSPLDVVDCFIRMLEIQPRLPPSAPCVVDEYPTYPGRSPSQSRRPEYGRSPSQARGGNMVRSASQNRIGHDYPPGGERTNRSGRDSSRPRVTDMDPYGGTAGYNGRPLYESGYHEERPPNAPGVRPPPRGADEPPVGVQEAPYGGSRGEQPPYLQQGPVAQAKKPPSVGEIHREPTPTNAGNPGSSPQSSGDVSQMAGVLVKEVTMNDDMGQKQRFHYIKLKDSQLPLFLLESFPGPNARGVLLKIASQLFTEIPAQYSGLLSVTPGAKITAAVPIHRDNPRLETTQNVSQEVRATVRRTISENLLPIMQVTDHSPQDVAYVIMWKVSTTEKPTQVMDIETQADTLLCCALDGSSDMANGVSLAFTHNDALPVTWPLTRTWVISNPSACPGSVIVSGTSMESGILLIMGLTKKH
eukprot:Protomagalhaensia_sp_Gyna_25__741@NODE_1353_length_1913_cov_92_768410_g1085_i0_p1_GENE_NODE_1353_length_1913_cov_92_768410_g1085_i0NODE_1353_length_1913_cov_92_768410_g1085_i0_p1_ORF_typecomplete_len561_score85_59_NODE_1353_length_1913_cov_92_768410_g1085_i01571839